MNYKAYLNSKKWAEKKDQFRKSEFYHNRCDTCGSPKNFDIYPRFLRNINKEGNINLFCLCGNCYKIRQNMTQAYEFLHYGGWIYMDSIAFEKGCEEPPETEEDAKEMAKILINLMETEPEINVNFTAEELGELLWIEQTEIWDIEEHD